LPSSNSAFYVPILLASGVLGVPKCMARPRPASGF
jgi:hypothetical protein